jgi:aminoglycoside N3'-acetyltransferase
MVRQLKSRLKAYLKAGRHFIANRFRAFTPADLQRRLEALGLARGDTILVHSSFDAFEGFQGKPSEVIALLQQLVGADGLVMMPTMTFTGSAIEQARLNRVFDVQRTPSRMGLLSELFRRSAGVVRSVHPTHPVAIWGDDAAAVAADHHLAATPCGAGTPFEQLLRRDGKIVLLGTGIGVLTFYHALEEFLEAELPLKPFTTEVFEMSSRNAEGCVVQTRCRLYEPAVSRRRNLHKLVPVLQQAGAWRTARVGGLELVVLGAGDVDAAVRRMSRAGQYCYD